MKAISYPVKQTDQVRHLKLVSESGLYSLIIRSRKPVAKPFQKWVTREVLPSIRKNGTYSM
jgi:prophage antirepressor-like protein